MTIEARAIDDAALPEQWGCNMSYPLDRKLAVEFIGMFLFVFVVGMATEKANGRRRARAARDRLAADDDGLRGRPRVGRPLQPGGQHGGLPRGKLTQHEYGAYVVTQLIAALLAGLLVRAIGGQSTPGRRPASAELVVEFLFTFALAYVVLNVATAKGTEGNSFYGLAIGFTWSSGRSRWDGSRAGPSTRRSRLARRCSGALQVVAHLGLPARRLPRGGGRRGSVPLPARRWRES